MASEFSFGHPNGHFLYPNMGTFAKSAHLNVSKNGPYDSHMFWTTPGSVCIYLAFYIQFYIHSKSVDVKCHWNVGIYCCLFLLLAESGSAVLYWSSSSWNHFSDQPFSCLVVNRSFKHHPNPNPHICIICILYQTNIVSMLLNYFLQKLHNINIGNSISENKYIFLHFSN